MGHALQTAIGKGARGLTAPVPCRPGEVFAYHASASGHDGLAKSG